MNNDEHIKLLEDKLDEIRTVKFEQRINRLIILFTLLGIILVGAYLDNLKADFNIFEKDCMNELNEIYLMTSEPIVVAEDPCTFEYLGEFKITHYCACEKCCGIYASGYTATGTLATPSRTIVVDPNIIPYGTEVLIEGNVYVAEACGGGIKENRIDIFCASHEEALASGVYTTSVYRI